MILNIACLWCFCFCVVFSRATAVGNSSALLKTLLNDYDKNDPPRKDSTTEVRVGIYLISIDSINEQSMEFRVSGYLRQSWNDPRLKFNDPKNDNVRMPDGAWERIWVPDTFMRNEKFSSFHEMTVSNRLLKVNSNGDIWYVIKFSSVLICPFKFQRFPLDSQECGILFESFGYTMDAVTLSLMSEPLTIDADIRLPQFTLTKMSNYDCSQNYSAGSYPCLEFLLHFRRDIGYYLTQVYLPTMLIVILSWFSFWINRDASTARILIGMLTLLTLSTMAGNARSFLPRLHYITAMDIWFGVCHAFVFLSLTEYVVVHVLVNMGNGVSLADRLKPPFHVPSKQQESVNGSEEQGRGKRLAHLFDWFSRICFPIAFIIFNFTYWIAYSSGKKE